MKKIIFAILFIFFAGYVGAEDFCSTYPPVWYDGFNFNSSEPSFKDLENFITDNVSTDGYAYFRLERGEEHSVYLPYGTKEIKFTIPNQTTVATYLLKINGIPSGTDVDISTSPLECIRQYEGNSTDFICPYTGAIYSLYGDDVLIDQVKQKNICPDFRDATLICSSPNTLWQGKTFNAVLNTLILSVPEGFWDNHHKGAWLVYSWRGGVGQYGMSITVDKNAFDSWYDSLSEEEKQSSITCPLNNNYENQNNNQNNNEENNQNNNNNTTNNNNDQNTTSGDQIGISTISFQIKQNNTLRVTFLMPENNENGTTYTYRWDFGDGTTNSTTVNKITHEYRWDDIVAAGNSLECKVSVLDDQNNVVANDSILIFGLKGKIRTGAFPVENAIVEIDNPWKLLLWIKRQ